MRKLLDWEDAHVGFDDAVEDVPPALRATVPDGSAHSLWQLLEHLRICQLDILDFCRNPAYAEMPANRELDLFARIPHASGQTYLRELILVADHNACHVGQFVALRLALVGLGAG